MMERETWKAVGALLDQWEFMANDEKQVIRSDYPNLTTRLDELMRVVTSEDGEATQTDPQQASKNDHITLRCPHCEQTYVAKIGNNPLVKDGLTITPVPLSVEVEVEGEQ